MAQILANAPVYV
jgi:hypothetical protein